MIRKIRVNLKIYDVPTWLTNNYNTHVAQYPNKDNQTMKFGLLIECNKRNNFLPKSCRKSRRLVPDPFLLFKKALNEVKASGLQLGLNILNIFPSIYHKIKTNCIKLWILDPET